MYRIIFSNEAKKAIRKLASNKQAMTKLEKLLEEIRENPRFGIGQIEQLKYSEETWSRRIDKKNRIIYSINDEDIIVIILSIIGHYENK